MANRTVTIAAMLALLTACSDSNEPNTSIVDAYTATSFTASESGSVTDVLQAGGSLTIRLINDTLTSDSLTTGTLLVPESLNEGVAVAYDLAGTWSSSQDTVTFTQSADTFVRDADWILNGSSLSTEFVNATDTIRVTLTRQ